MVALRALCPSKSRFGIFSVRLLVLPTLTQKVAFTYSLENDFWAIKAMSMRHGFDAHQIHVSVAWL